jgi:hypothetical protein
MPELFFHHLAKGVRKRERGRKKVINYHTEGKPPVLLPAVVEVQTTHVMGNYSSRRPFCVCHTPTLTLSPRLTIPHVLKHFKRHPLLLVSTAVGTIDAPDFVRGPPDDLTSTRRIAFCGHHACARGKAKRGSRRCVYERPKHRSAPLLLAHAVCGAMRWECNHGADQSKSSTAPSKERGFSIFEAFGHVVHTPYAPEHSLRTTPLLHTHMTQVLQALLSGIWAGGVRKCVTPQICSGRRASICCVCGPPASCA